MYIIQAKNATYRREDRILVNNVNWTVKKGENWVIFGPNGSGKTTLLKMITGYIRPSEGEISVLDCVIGKCNLPELRKNIAWVSSSIQSLIHESDPVIEIVVAGAKAHTRMWEMPDKKELVKAVNILKKFGLEPAIRKAYKLLSQGEQKKVMIARALMLSPKLIILDEPCEGLDIAARENFLKDIESLSQFDENLSIILVTHHVEEILPMFSKILFLKEGNLFLNGNIDDHLNSKLMKDVFDMDIMVEKKNKRFFTYID